MRILLIKPSQRKVYGTNLPPPYPWLGILYIAAVLEKHSHSVKLFDSDIDAENSLKDIVRDFKPQLVGITSVTPTLNEAYSLAHRIKELEDVPIVLGGVHATIAPKECISRKDIDFVAVGEGEQTAVELVEAIENDKKDFSSINGLWYKQNGKIYNNPRRQLEDSLDNIPFPAWHLIKKWRKFRPPDAQLGPAAPIMTSRGCPADCTFCCTKLIFGKRYRMRSIENVINEIEMLLSQYNIKEIHFMDDTFNLSKRRVLDFCNRVKKRGLELNFQFSNGLRADYIDKEVLSALKSINVKNVGFGIETGNKSIMKSIKKNLDLKKAKEAFNISKKMGFETWGFFIFGFPGDTDKTIRDTIRFAKASDPLFAKFLILKPYPGTEVYQELISRNLITDFNFDNYGTYTPPVHHLESITSKKILYWQKRAYREFYLRPHKIISHILRINSLYKLKLAIKNLFFIVGNFFNIIR